MFENPVIKTEHNKIQGALLGLYCENYLQTVFIYSSFSSSPIGLEGPYTLPTSVAMHASSFDETYFRNAYTITVEKKNDLETSLT